MPRSSKKGEPPKGQNLQPQRSFSDIFKGTFGRKRRDQSQASLNVALDSPKRENNKPGNNSQTNEPEATKTLSKLPKSSALKHAASWQPSATSANTQTPKPRFQRKSSSKNSAASATPCRIPTPYGRPLSSSRWTQTNADQGQNTLLPAMSRPSPDTSLWRESTMMSLDSSFRASRLFPDDVNTSPRAPFTAPLAASFTTVADRIVGGSPRLYRDTGSGPATGVSPRLYRGTGSGSAAGGRPKLYRDVEPGPAAGMNTTGGGSTRLVKTNRPRYPKGPPAFSNRPFQRRSTGAGQSSSYGLASRGTSFSTARESFGNNDVGDDERLAMEEGPARTSAGQAVSQSLLDSSLPGLQTVSSRPSYDVVQRGLQKPIQPSFNRSSHSFSLPIASEDDMAPSSLPRKPSSTINKHPSINRMHMSTPTKNSPEPASAEMLPGLNPINKPQNLTPGHKKPEPASVNKPDSPASTSKLELPSHVKKMGGSASVNKLQEPNPMSKVQQATSTKSKKQSTSGKKPQEPTTVDKLQKPASNDKPQQPASANKLQGSGFAKKLRGPAFTGKSKDAGPASEMEESTPSNKLQEPTMPSKNTRRDSAIEAPKADSPEPAAPAGPTLDPSDPSNYVNFATGEIFGAPDRRFWAGRVSSLGDRYRFQRAAAANFDPEEVRKAHPEAFDNTTNLDELKKAVFIFQQVGAKCTSQTARDSLQAFKKEYARLNNVAALLYVAGMEAKPEERRGSVLGGFFGRK